VAHPVFSPPGSYRPIDILLSPIQFFLRVQAAGGILLLACTAIALVWANSAWGDAYHDFWHTYLSVGFGDTSVKMSLAHFVNDGLMAIFFFVVGLEIKREMLVGELASLRKAAIPITAAVGGMLVPALIFFAFAGRGAGKEGWAIPMATDIAFAVGVMAMLGRRVPLALKVFLTALAIADDLGAVAVIAIFYGSDASYVTPMVETGPMLKLAGAGGLLVLSLVANLLGVRTPIVYAILGVFMWVMLLQSGVHATVGGVLLALTIPSKVRIDTGRFTTFARAAVDAFEKAGDADDHILTNPRRQSVVVGLEEACEHVQAPLGRLEHGLHRTVAFLIMPVFALANAGIPLGEGFGDAAGHGVGLGIGLGLLVGKPVGVVLFTWLALRLGLGQLPPGISMRQIVGAGFLAGIGFTMSLFITNLAYTEYGMLQLAKTSILVGSLVAGIVGFVILYTSGSPPDEPNAG
jgi:NhaA family Na+:H+ antiporter